MRTAKTEAVLLFDANMSGPLRCRGRCRHDPDHLCVHRFGRHVRAMVLPHEKKDAPDLGVAKYLIRIATKGLPGTTIRDTRWIIVTRDKRFCTSVRHQHDSVNRRGRTEMMVCQHLIIAAAGSETVCIEVVPINSKNAGTGNVPYLRRALTAVQALLARPRAV